MRATNKRAIVKFHKADMEAAKKTPGGLVIVSGGNVSDRDLFYEPQKCEVIDIADSGSMFKKGDMVYVEYQVYTDGESQNGATRTLEKHDEYVVKHCLSKEIICKIENGTIVPAENIVLAEKRIEEEVKQGKLVVFKKLNTNRFGYEAKVIYAGSEAVKQGVVPGTRIICNRMSDYSYNKIEGQWLYAIHLTDVLAINGDDSQKKEMV